jgi:hypothetical protein
MCRSIIKHAKVKQSHYSPWQAPRDPGVWGSQILRQSAHKDKVVSPTRRPPLPQEIFLLLISFKGWVNSRAIVRPEGICQWKFPMTTSRIDPAIFRFVAQCLNHNKIYNVTRIILFNLFSINVVKFRKLYLSLSVARPWTCQPQRSLQGIKFCATPL